MASYITYIADPELESEVIKAIKTIGGVLAVRGVSLAQIHEVENLDGAVLVATRSIAFKGQQVSVDKGMNQEEIIARLQPNSSKRRVEFNKGNSKVISIVGLSGGVGTTSIAINLAFELSQDSNLLLIDSSNTNPDIARALGLHRIDSRVERVSTRLSVSQGIPNSCSCEKYLFELGTDLESPIIEQSDEIYLVTRLGFNTLPRLRESEITPTAVLFNFAERSKISQRWRQQIVDEFPRMKCVNIPMDSKALEMAAERKSALIEVAANSPARRAIATLA